MHHNVRTTPCSKGLVDGRDAETFIATGVTPLLTLICDNEVANNGKSIIALVYLS